MGKYLTIEMLRSTSVGSFWVVSGEIGAICYTFHSKSIFHKNMPSRNMF